MGREFILWGSNKFMRQSSSPFIYNLHRFLSRLLLRIIAICNFFDLIISAGFKIKRAGWIGKRNVCRQTAIDNLHATSLNGAVTFILRKDERICVCACMCACVCCREPAVKLFRHVYRVHTLCVCVCIFYTLRSSLLTVGCMFAACSRGEVASKVSLADAFYGSHRSRSVSEEQRLPSIFPKHA